MRRMSSRNLPLGICAYILVLCLAISLALSACRASVTLPAEDASGQTEAVQPEIMLTEPEALPPEELLRIYRTEGVGAEKRLREELTLLRENDPARGELWTGLFDAMFAVNRGIVVEEGNPPAGLPEDGSLCIVVFGFCLEPDGSMAPELIGRCEAALICAQAYPNAWIAVTGGPTAADDPRATEAREMARYLVAHGVPGERILLEERALSTADNAIYVEQILTERFPQVDSLLIVSSSYHVPLCALLMTETALLDGYAYGSRPYSVVGNFGFPVADHGDYEAPTILADYTARLVSSYTEGND